MSNQNESDVKNKIIAIIYWKLDEIRLKTHYLLIEDSKHKLPIFEYNNIIVGLAEYLI